MLAIIGGTGIYQLEGLKVIESHSVETPFGAPSADIIEGQMGARKLFFLPRHGNQHQLLPSEVNYRANIWALKSLGVTQVIGISAVGSLRHEIAPGDFSIASQYFDFVKGDREKSFFGGGLAAHVSTAEPTCDELTKALVETGQSLDMPIHTGKTYGCVDGPRLGTRAESFFLRDSAKCDLVGMTNVPEVFLAREAQICYCTLAIATDYDCWLDDPSQHVTVEQVIARYGASLERAKQLLTTLLNSDRDIPESDARSALACAVLTPESALSAEKAELLALLKR
ncbi:MAG: S-methyl-5'-thioadenosine phosphorylase [Motiliproteus sp.]|nr:S-methyl-5'-thioadenosine phosphorylase [Motiliproteus sp.]MCW9054248.1 S-methyl-5'-thioadenosine phosphorylase [Motiliproteus sp.]